MMLRKIKLPYKNEAPREVECEQALLLIGANGSGKTRLGSWIDNTSEYAAKVHRISAQKSLNMPSSVTPLSIDQAEKDLLYGAVDAQIGSEQTYKYNRRYSNSPVTILLNDFQKLMVYLFSDQTEENAKYVTASKQTELKVPLTATKLDIVKGLWEKILPHRKLIINGLSIKTTISTTSEILYSPSEMGDGERVIFYLIGQCLAAPKDGIIIIDEPELHLHKSIQAPLWSEIQKSREDCLFIYLTHDIDFAISQEDSKKIWLKSFDGSTWDWEEVTDFSGFPEDLLLEILGSRKSIVFIEGDKGSLDYELYRLMLDDFLILPVGSCDQVIQSVKSFRNNPQLHHLKIFGIIDRDRRLKAEIDALLCDDIYTLGVAEVENLFCTRGILAFLSKKLARDVDADFQIVSDKIFEFIESEFDLQVSLKVSGEIKFKLNFFNDKAIGSGALDISLIKLFDSINVSDLYNQYKSELRKIIEDRDFDSLLNFYNRKSLSSRVGGYLGLKDKELPKMLLRYARTDDIKEIREILKKYFGDFAKFIK